MNVALIFGMVLVVAAGSAVFAAASPPSGRPPMGALERHDPRMYRIGFEVELDIIAPPRLPHRVDPLRINLANAEFFLPVIMQSTFSRTDADSLDAAMWLDNVGVPNVNDHGRLDTGQRFNAPLAVIPMPEFAGNNVRWRFEQTIQVWSSRINEAEAAEATWPRQWPEEARDGLQPQAFIESDAPIFRETIERITEGKLRTVSPYFAAKDIVRYVLQNVQVSGSRTHRRDRGVIEGLNVSGAKHTATEGIGSPHDVVCLCVAMLRAAGIPARPVVGYRRIPPRNRLEFVSWAEFYLPDSGWVPFDPVDMQGKGLHRDVREPWPEFGTMRELNERIPIAFGFTPARGRMGPGPIDVDQVPSVWGWRPKGSVSPYLRQQIRVSMESLGRGREERH